MEKNRSDICEGKPYLFISYAHQDTPFVQSLIEQLRQNDYYYWYDEGIESGRDWSDEIAERIEKCAQFVLVLSPNANDSDNVNDEIYYAKDCGRPFCIICTESVNLNRGLKLKLGRIQWINQSDYPTQTAFFEQIIRSISIDAKKQTVSCVARSYQELTQRYSLEKEIGRGGSGIVFRGRDNRTGNVVAIKHSAFSQNYSGHLLTNLYRSEKKALTLLHSCPFVPKLIDWYEDENNIYLVQNYITGVSPNKLDFGEDAILEFARGVLQIFSYLDQYKIVHKDIKPQNLKIDAHGTVYLLDFGGCYIPGSERDSRPVNIATPSYAPPEQRNMLTSGGVESDTPVLLSEGTAFLIEPESYNTGIINFGTFVSPELTEDQPLSFATDCFSFGRTLQSLLVMKKMGQSGFWDFDGSVRDLRKDISQGLDEILLKMTSQQQQDRYQSPDELRKAFQDCNHDMFNYTNKNLIELVSNAPRYQVKQLETKDDETTILPGMTI